MRKLQYGALVGSSMDSRPLNWGWGRQCREKDPVETYDQERRPPEELRGAGRRGQLYHTEASLVDGEAGVLTSPVVWGSEPTLG